MDCDNITDTHINDSISNGNIDKIVKCFNDNTKKIENYYNLFEKHKNLEIIQSKYGTDYKKNINQLMDENTTAKRNIEINYNLIRRKEEKNRLLKYIFVAIAVVSIVPLLSMSKISVVPKTLGFLIWLIVMVVILLVLVFKLFIENRHRDDINFFEYNFEKPSNNENARSKMQQELSKKDR